ncbi:hypothetical protein EJ04DRAFT_300138 [Polyplosphaeria fusca]|uniref:WKF domain-containing protein n=1 Tax=Polyplosphaeria fusca TaxID=682080 RepID=A0A9P4QUU3_9PLEO|nr:hypothetical protein EJ04DRAFT_300138 [Polyplosphaeria fusca]
MDQPGTRLPAWQRLGLKLKNFPQSGDTAPDADLEHPIVDTRTSRGARGQSRQLVQPAQNGKPSRLGKRNLDDTAEGGEQQSRKKSKKDDGQTDADGDAAVRVYPVDPPVSVSRGDPNYRRKTKKGRGERPSLLASTETEYATSEAALPPMVKSIKLSSAEPASSPPRTDRRKSVTFTPDTKTADGNSASELYRKWAADQVSLGPDAEFSPAELDQFAPPPKLHPANGVPAPQPSAVKGAKNQGGIVEKKAKTKQKVKTPTQADPPVKAEQTPRHGPANSTSKKKDHSIYLSYLSQYYQDRENWKFNKAKQNDVIDNALNVFRIPEEYMDALIEYVKGLKGAGVINRLSEQCKARIEEVDREDQEAKSTMDDQEQRKAAKEEALADRLAQEKKRRRLDADVEGLNGHPHPDAFIRRLKRRRAEALLTALGLAMPASPPEHTSQLPKKHTRKRKSRTDVESSDSSSSSESEAESDSEPSSSSSEEDESDTSSSDEGDSD